MLKAAKRGCSGWLLYGCWEHLETQQLGYHVTLPLTAAVVELHFMNAVGVNDDKPVASRREWESARIADWVSKLYDESKGF